ncbi:MAG TPA: hypothetical protein VJT32_13165 [bacterium]|nr:hypothetical protein [bacterium]
MTTRRIVSRVCVAIFWSACLVGVTSAPGLAQPFGGQEVPSWAYVAMQGLGRHGLLPNPPVSLQQGHLTRAEMAVLLAQVLAMINQPRSQGAPAQAEVTPQDLETIRALLREFEAELASLDVRVEAARRNLDRLAENVRHVRISGEAELRYDLSRSAVNNPGVGPLLPASTQPLAPTVSSRLRLSLDGGVTDDLRLKIRITTFDEVGNTAGLWGGTPPMGHQNSTFFPLNSSVTPGTLATASLDWSHALGLPLEIQLGQLGGDTWVPHEGNPLTPLSLAPPDPMITQFGPIGLLFSTAKDPAGERSLRTYVVNGLTATYGTTPIQVRGLVADVESLQGAYGNELLYGGRIQFTAAPEVTVGLNAVFDTCDGTGAVNNTLLVSALTALGAGKGLAQCSFVWWGAQNGWLPSLNTGSTNPYTNIPGQGYSVDLDMGLGPDLRLQTEVALWSDPTAQTTGLGWHAQLVASSLLGPGSTVIVGYQYFGSAFYPPFGGAEDPVVGFIYPGGFQDVFLIVAFPQVSGWMLSAGYEAGTSLGVGPQPGAVGFGGPAFSSAVCQQCSPSGQPFSGWSGVASHALGPETMLQLYYYGWEINGVSQTDVYRAALTYRF